MSLTGTGSIHFQEKKKNWFLNWAKIRSLCCHLLATKYSTCWLWLLIKTIKEDNLLKCACFTVINFNHSPYPANGEIVELDMLNDLIQQPVCHSIKVCKRVYLQGETAGSSLCCFTVLPTRDIKTTPVKHTWFLSDMRKSSLDPGSPSSMNVFTSRRSALFPTQQK